ncbi:hypothetical protein ACIGHN_12775 [Acidovorax sp. NPDC077693]|uniref:hypothetical protein n=1 Tax=unclassified Acidovorax TaxID=2684926 RepID=UPI0037CA1EA2
MSNDARPEAFAEAAKSGLTAANAATLATCTLVGGSLSVFADVAPSGWSHVMGFVALASWLCSITLALYLAGRSTRPQEVRGLLTTVADGVRLAGAKPGIAAMVVLMTAGAAFTVWSKTHSDQGSLLRSLVATQDRTAAAAESAAERTAAIQADTQAIRSAVGRPATPAEMLAGMGYGTSDYDVCRAISAGAIKALQLMERLVEFKARLSVALGGGQYALCIEEALAEPTRGPAVARALQAIEVSAEDVNRLYVAQTIGSGNSAALRPLEVLATLGIDNGPRARLTSARATPLMYAIWADNLPAAEALLAKGADANQPSRFDYALGTRMASVAVSPLAEAQRLVRPALEKKLRAAGARVEVQQVPYFR